MMHEHRWDLLVGWDLESWRYDKRGCSGEVVEVHPHTAYSVAAWEHQHVDSSAAPVIYPHLRPSPYAWHQDWRWVLKWMHVLAMNTLNVEPPLGGAVSTGLSQYQNAPQRNPSLTWAAEGDGSHGRWGCEHEDVMSRRAHGLPLMSTRDRFAELKRSFALDKAENNRFLPFVHER